MNSITSFCKFCWLLASKTVLFANMPEFNFHFALQHCKPLLSILLKLSLNILKLVTFHTVASHHPLHYIISTFHPLHIYTFDMPHIASQSTVTWLLQIHECRMHFPPLGKYFLIYHCHIKDLFYKALHYSESTLLFINFVLCNFLHSPNNSFTTHSARYAQWAKFFILVSFSFLVWGNSCPCPVSRHILFYPSCVTYTTNQLQLLLSILILHLLFHLTQDAFLYLRFSITLQLPFF